LTEKEVIFEGDLIKIFGERPFHKEIAENKKTSEDIDKDKPKEEIAEENSK